MTKPPVQQFFVDIVSVPKWGSGALAVWRRNYFYFRHTLFTTLAWIFVEPLLYLFALGYGLGQFVSHIEGMSYAQYIAPAMMATSGMFVAFFEGTYSTYTKLTRQFTFQTILLTPLSTDEIVIGEIMWITSKAFLSVISVGIVLMIMGLVSPHNILPAWCMLLLMCWVFASLGVWLSTLAKSYEWFSYSQSGFIMPMSLFCGTYFPLKQLPGGLIYLSYALPLTHGLMSVRMFLAGEFNSMFFINAFYLIVVGLVLTNVAAARFERKLIL
jgi:lipooligosaccharide transport system permease protein